MSLVAGVDTSTQSCKILIVDADTGHILRQGISPHPLGTEVDPESWWEAFQDAAEKAGGLKDIDALSVGGQQHGLVALDQNGKVIRKSLLWNDTRSAPEAMLLRQEFDDWANVIGSLPIASLTITKLRWVHNNEPENAQKIAAIALPHDWLTWKISGSTDINDLVTDRSDASGTGYFDAKCNIYRRDLLSMALRRNADNIVLPRVLLPGEYIQGPEFLLAGGCGDNAGAALGLDLKNGETSLSLGTSGVVAAVSATPTSDGSGLVTGFADAAGGFLPLVCTLNGSRILDTAASLLGVDYTELSRLALAAPPGAEGIVQVPWFEGERTPNLPNATASTWGLTLSNTTRENYARAAVEGMLCLMGAGIDAIRKFGVSVEAITLIGGAAKSLAVREIAPVVLGVPITVPEPAEYVALGAARQAAWALTGKRPNWPASKYKIFEGTYEPSILAQYHRYSDTLIG